MFHNEDENKGMRGYSFSSSGGSNNLSTFVTFDLHEDESWYELHRRFVNFLESCGYIFGLDHPIREIGNGD